MSKVNVMLTKKHKEMFESFSKVMSTKGRKRSVVSQQILFTFAAAYGFMERSYIELSDKEKTESYARIEYFRRDPTLEALIIAIAYSHMRREHPSEAAEKIVNLTWDDIYTIAENYAAGGIETIYADMGSKDKELFAQDLETMLLQIGGEQL